MLLLSNKIRLISYGKRARGEVMIRIAICDDEAECLDGTKQMLEKWSAERDVPVNILCFDNGDALIAKSSSDKLDIIFLDIVMPLLNGMDAAREIRERDKATIIIFLTSSPEFALESYSVKAKGYIVKPVKYEQLSEALDECTAALREEPKNLLLKSTCGYQKIYHRDIDYLEAQNKQVIFFLHSGKSVMITEPLYSFENKLLIEDGFFKCHRSYIVYMPNVNSFTSNEITMRADCRIPIARGMGKKFHDAYFSFMFRDK